jgi:hypothetical protein
MPGYSFVIAWTVAGLGDAAAFAGEARRANEISHCLDRKGILTI